MHQCPGQKLVSQSEQHSYFNACTSCVNHYATHTHTYTDAIIIIIIMPGSDDCRVFKIKCVGVSTATVDVIDEPSKFVHENYV